MEDVTQILEEIAHGQTSNSEELLPVVYNELRRLAADWLAKEPPGQTIQPTALVHEAYLRLIDVEHVQQWSSRGHFFAAAAESMRRILVERARKKLRQKYGGQWRRIDLTPECSVSDARSSQLLALNEALNVFQEKHHDQAELVKLRYFLGLSQEEAAAALGISRSTASRYWTFARSWLYCALDETAAVECVNTKSQIS